MKVILLKTLGKLGKEGVVVEVKDGYARNYLIPRGLVLKANPQNIKQLEAMTKQKEMKKARALNRSKQIAEKLKKLSLTIPVQVGEEDKVFGSVTSQEIAELLLDKGYDIDKKQINLDEPIKALGIYEIPIKLHPDVNASVKLWVIKA